MSTEPDAEREALAALDSGDRRRALTILMKTYGDAIYRHCRAVCADETLAADVHQTVFVEAWRDMARFSRRSSLRTWLFAIARHRCLDALKSVRRRGAKTAAFDTEEGPIDLPDEAPGADEQLDRSRRATPLARCLEALQPSTRTAVLLRYQEEMSYEDMAAVAEEKPGTLQARVARAMPVLRKCLERLGILASEI